MCPPAEGRRWRAAASAAGQRTFASTAPAQTRRASATTAPCLIVLTRHPKAATTRLVLGSVPDQVMRTANCPALAIPPGQDDREHHSNLIYANRIWKEIVRNRIHHLRRISHFAAVPAG